MVYVKSRLGVRVAIKCKIVKQDHVMKRHDSYYVLHTAAGKTFDVAEPVPGVPVVTLDMTVEQAKPVSNAPEWSDRQLPKAEHCESAGLSMVAGTNVDYHAAEKVKGETFFTHKTAPGLVIKSPEGKVIHETKMADMYKRRD